VTDVSAPVPIVRLVGRTDVLDDEAVAAELRAAVALAGLLVGDAGVAQDIGAEAVARWYAAAQQRPILDAHAYVRRIVCNLVYGRFRRLRVERRYRAQLAADEPHADTTDDIARNQQLRAVLHGLPGRQRAVIVLRYFEDLSEQDTAAVLDIPVGTVKSTAARALDALRRALEESEDA
jgi:RNA polymerase sigma factor (sigma-70 family)